MMRICVVVGCFMFLGGLGYGVAQPQNTVKESQSQTDNKEPRSQTDNKELQSQTDNNDENKSVVEISKQNKEI